MSSTDEHKKRSGIKDFLAGGLSGGCTRFIVAPFDVVKIRFQVQVEPVRRGSSSGKYKSVAQAIRTIIHEEGPRALWRGNLTAEYLWISYSAVQFAAYQYILTWFKTNHDSTGSATASDLGTVGYLASGGLAGFVATVTTYPFDLARTRLAAQGEPRVYPNLSSCITRTVRDQGLRGLWQGLPPTVVQIVPYMALQFAIYETLKERFDVTRPLQHLACGAAAGTMSKLAVIPLDVVKKRRQMTGVARSQSYGTGSTLHYKGTLDCVRQIYHREGISGFYKGSIPSLYKAAPSAALSFLFFDLFSSLLNSR